jgi:hypothetical protein
MAKEGEAASDVAEGVGITFTDIHYNLTKQTITFKKEDEVVATIVFEGKLPAAGVFSSLANRKPFLPALKPRQTWLKQYRRLLRR